MNLPSIRDSLITCYHVIKGLMKKYRRGCIKAPRMTIPLEAVVGKNRLPCYFCEPCTRTSDIKGSRDHRSFHFCHQSSIILWELRSHRGIAYSSKKWSHSCLSLRWYSSLAAMPVSSCPHSDCSTRTATEASPQKKLGRWWSRVWGCWPWTRAKSSTR